MKQQNISYSYFLVKQPDKQIDQNYYLFFYAQESIQIDFIYQSIDLIQELDSKQRKLRSFRGFFLYALEIMQKAKEYEILQTNLQPFFWKKVKNIIRQNKKSALHEFLFGKNQDNKPDTTNYNIAFDDTIQNLQKSYDGLREQVNSLQHRVCDLETKLTTLENSNYPLSDTLNAPNDIKITQHGNYTLKENQGSYLTENDSQANFEVQEIPTMESKSISEAYKIDSKVSSTTQQYNRSSNQDQGLQKTNSTTLAKIPEQEKIEIIKTGFQLQAEGKLSLKKYYQSTEPNSLFQSKGYSIKYETIRRTEIYRSLKE